MTWPRPLPRIPVGSSVDALIATREADMASYLPAMHTEAHDQALEQIDRILDVTWPLYQRRAAE